MQGPDYKQKYLELRTRYLSDLDVSFRLGFEAGAQQAQQQQALDTEAKANEQAMAQAQGQPGQQPGEGAPEGQPGQGEQPDGQPPQGIPDASAGGVGGSELDQHIGKLESMLGSDSDPEIKKSLEAILSIRKAEKFAVDMKKSQDAINGITKALHKPNFKLGVQASHNLNDSSKKAVSMQHKIVNDIMKSWGKEEEKAKNSIESILNIDGLLKG